MSDDIKAIRRDLNIVEAMADELRPYLLGESQHWPLSRGDMPRMTLGGCMMRCHRLPLVSAELDTAEEARIKLACRRVENVLDEQVVRLEKRGHQELRARLGEWMHHLRNWAEMPALTVEEYAQAVDTRLVIEMLLERLGQPPVKLEEKWAAETARVDNYLRGCWEEGAFVWAPVWQPAYGKDRFWWLYGRPRCKPGAKARLM